ncbi:hypothetical protein [Candidatus Vampirococcus lugosii]|uniref:O-antigen ligase domain-containing protein n=1 Tax=Candidatus Vampirococcus lugosii TaxID=2789015 RepID=A0ABS5QMC2_9BACT|nr:hypothetical protein [Candidatus Vampirococcus lugosii]MBS8122317.1 hypothetical protein [Candidatus Vampirococcus lugosii]
MIINFVKLFVIFIFSYYILNTFFVYGIFDGQFQLIFSLLKEIIWFFFVLLLIIFNFDKFKKYLIDYKYFIILLLFYIFWGILISLINQKGLYDIFIGIKYNIFFVIIFLSSTFVGTVLIDKVNKKDIIKFINFIFYSLIISLIIGIFWQLMKFGFKEEFIKYLGYGPVGDWKFGEKPPIYYRTGPDGLARFNGIFAGPNNYGFLLVLFLSFFVSKSFEFMKQKQNKTKNSIKSIAYSSLYILGGLATFSRGFILAGIIQFWYFLPYKLKKNKKIIGIGIFLLLFLISILSFVKFESTKLHISETLNAIIFAINNSMGLGFGSSGPAIHHRGEILPENMYLQVFIDSGAIGFIIWIGIIFFIFLGIRKIGIFSKNKETKKLQKYLLLLSIGFYGLLIEGLFLHVFEDSIINYIFFITYGILYGYLYDEYKKVKIY